MRIVVLGGTWFLGRRVVERLRARGDEVLVVHRGRGEPEGGDGSQHLHADRQHLAEHRARLRDFGPDAVVDSFPLTARDVDAVLPALPDVPAVVLSSQDVYQAFTGLRTGRCEAPVPIDEDAGLRRERHPYRGLGLDGVPDDYDKLDVEERWLARDAVILRLPVVYGPHDRQRREDLVLRRLRAGRTRIPVGAGDLLWTRAHVDDVATGVLAALDTRAADGLAVNLGETLVWPVRTWIEQILAAAGSDAELVRVPDEVLPPDLALTAAPAQHLLMSVAGPRSCSAGRRATPRPGWPSRCAGTSTTRRPRRPGPPTTPVPTRRRSLRPAPAPPDVPRTGSRPGTCPPASGSRAPRRRRSPRPHRRRTARGTPTRPGAAPARRGRSRARRGSCGSGGAA